MIYQRERFLTIFASRIKMTHDDRCNLYSILLNLFLVNLIIKFRMPIIKTLRGKIPQFGKDVFIAENAVIIGDVIVGDQCSVWYNVVIRGDVHSIRIGNQSNIQDGTVIHCTYKKASTQIGNRVTVGHSAVIHGCTLHDSVLVGMGAKILDLAVVESNVIVAAGSLVLEKSVLESGYLYAGVPAKKIKPLSPEQITGIQHYADQYIMYKEWYLEEE